MSVVNPVIGSAILPEPLVPPVQAQAHKLLAEAGSPEIAKQAIDSAVGDKMAGSPGDKFAAQWGFDSYLSLFEGSIPVASVGGKNWCVTSISGGGWILWNDADLVATRHSSREEAERQLQDGVGTASPDPTGLDT